jgi:diguanylate cyclase (GGDEF)-like protein
VSTPDARPGTAAHPRAAAAADWLVRAQDGQAAAVLAEIDAALADGRDLDPALRARAQYAQAIALSLLGDGARAVDVGRALCARCAELGLTAFGVRARALLVHLLQAQGHLDEAAEQLAHAVTLEPALQDLHDPEVQAALGALAVALRLSDVPDEAGRVEARLAAVEPELPVHQRVSRWSNLAFEHAGLALAAARRVPYEVDEALLGRAVEEIERARMLAVWRSYDVVSAEAQVLAAVREAFTGDPAVARRRLATAATVLDRGPEAASAQLFWAAASVRALVRLGRATEAARAGRTYLERITGGGRDGERLVLAYEVMRAEHPGTEFAGSGTAEFVELAQRRLVNDGALVSALFRTRLDLLRGADERQSLMRAASLDPLTGLVNRRGAVSAVEGAARRPPGYQVALLLIDLDGFKDVNDSRGHLAGDGVLQEVAAALRTAARSDDVVARWGGDEFVVVAELGPIRASALADRLRDKIRESDTGVTASVGVAVRETPIEERAWLSRADVAMYTAKRLGGDATQLG